jgi:DNA-binding IclR family transcriptional regulator
MPPIPTSSGNTIAERTLDVLMLFSAGRSSLTINQAAEELGMPRSTVYRYLQSLRSYSLVEEENGRYRLGPKILELALAAWAGSELCEVALPWMRGLADRTGETVMLARLSDGSAVCIERLQSKHAVRISMERGSILPWNASGAKVLLAAQDQSKVRSLLGQRPLKAYNDRTVTDPVGFARDLERVAENGYAVNDGEVDPGLWGVAAPIRNSAGLVMAALSVSIPRYRLDEGNVEQLIEDVRSTALKVGQRLMHDK